jgi:hypothetical protein
MPSDAISILYDHYKDTCSIISDAVKRRDRAMSFAVIALGFFAFQSIFPSAADHAVTDLLDFKFGLTLQVDFSIIGNIVWVSVLLFTLRYFQTHAFVERQYAYIHGVEDKLNKIAGDDLITREGKAYLHKYPKFSDWMSFLYTFVLPVLLLVVTWAKIVSEWLQLPKSGVSLGLLFDTLVFALLLVSITLYLAMLHPKK